MTLATPTSLPQPRLTSRLVNGLLAIKPIANLAKHQARSMMIKRAESIGVYWHQEVAKLRAKGDDHKFSPDWDAALASLQVPGFTYPDYYLRSFHAYEAGNLGWEPAMEVEVAAQAVHARIWPDGGAEGDSRLRQTYHQALRPQLSSIPQQILDLGCSVGMSTFALQAEFPKAEVTGVDLSPYFLAIADYRTQQKQQAATLNRSIRWIHAAAEAVPLPDASFDLVSACLVYHELPQTAAVAILREARRLLRPSGHLAIMDMNPRSAVYAAMPPYILTLLKSTEPYLDQYFSLDLERAIQEAGFQAVTLTENSPRHRTIVATAA